MQYLKKICCCCGDDDNYDDVCNDDDYFDYGADNDDNYDYDHYDGFTTMTTTVSTSTINVAIDIVDTVTSCVGDDNLSHLIILGDEVEIFFRRFLIIIVINVPDGTKQIWSVSAGGPFSQMGMHWIEYIVIINTTL